MPIQSGSRLDKMYIPLQKVNWLVRPLDLKISPYDINLAKSFFEPPYTNIRTLTKLTISNEVVTCEVTVALEKF